MNKIYMNKMFYQTSVSKVFQYLTIYFHVTWNPLGWSFSMYLLPLKVAYSQKMYFMVFVICISKIIEQKYCPLTLLSNGIVVLFNSFKVWQLYHNIFWEYFTFMYQSNEFFSAGSLETFNVKKVLYLIMNIVQKWQCTVTVQ